MKNLTRYALVAVMAALLISPALAQQAGPGQGRQRQGGEAAGEQRGRNMMAQIEQRIFAKLSLTDKQKADIKALNEKQQKEMEAIRKSEGTREQKMQKMRELRTQREKSLQTILGNEKFAQYRKMMQEEMKKLREQREKNGGGRPGGQKQPR